MKNSIRLLLVDDDKDDYEITLGLIEEIDDAPYALEWAKDYESGLAALRSGSFGACLLDYRLGAKSGLDFLKAAQKWGNTVPVILFTNFSDRATEREVLAAGAADYLLKSATNGEGLRRALRIAMERNLALETSRKLRDRLAISDRMASIGTMAAGVAHEINNPLAAVVGYLDMAAEALKTRSPGPENAELEDLLRHAGQAAQRVRQTVKDLKLFSRPEERRNVCIDIQATMESSLRMAWNEIRHRARVVKSYSKVPFIEANETRLGQIFLNLLLNAAQAISPGHVQANEIHISIGEEGESIAVEIEDSGSGMLPGEISKIFEVFYSTKVSCGGTGLGLAICKGIAEDMGGEIRVRSEPGKGSRFTLLLPKALACAAPLKEPETAAPPPGRRGKVLVLDDEPELLSLLELLLSREHQITALGDPREALKQVAAGESFDAILCDMMMPEMTGMEFYKELEVSHPAQAKRVIFVSGGAFSTAEDEFMGMSENFIEKPFDREILLTKVRAMVSA